MKYEITPELLKRIAGASGSKKVIDGLVQYLPDVMDDYNIDTRLRIAHFLGQLAHESDHFRTLQEYATGDAYEGRRDLGNTKRGDGRRYKGRGPIQITGRYNYRKYGDLLGVDLENNPELAASPEIGVKIAAAFWNENGLNDWADQDKIKVITRRINGGYNGLQSRIDMVERAKDLLTVKTNAPAPTPVPKKETPKPVKPEPTPVPVKNEDVTPLPFFVMNDLGSNEIGRAHV